jgi:hypothetical protein
MDRCRRRQQERQPNPFYPTTGWKCNRGRKPEKPHGHEDGGGLEHVENDEDVPGGWGPTSSLRELIP